MKQDIIAQILAELEKLQKTLKKNKRSREEVKKKHPDLFKKD